MAEVRTNFNQILRSKFYKLPRNLKKSPAVVKLFESYQIDCDEFKTDFAKESLNEDDMKQSLGIAVKTKMTPHFELIQSLIDNKAWANPCEPRNLLRPANEFHK